MHTCSLRSAANLLTLCFLCSGAATATAITKCIKNGNVTYTDLPCPADADIAPFTGQVSPPDDPEAAQQRYLANQKKLRQIDLETQRLEGQQQREARSAAQYAKQKQEQQYRCKQLDAKRKLAQLHKSDNPPGVNKSKAERARLLTQQAEDRFNEHCSGE